MIKYSEYEQEAISVALTAIEQKMVNSNVMNSPEEVRNYLKIKLATEPDEWFAVIFLTNKNHLISFQKLFRGTVNASHVHIRVIARMALEFNAAAVILAHNHPSGIAEPSNADKGITTSVKEALEIFDVRVLDHFIVSSWESCSFLESGWL
jgi:DNA repair protein RadC